MRKMIEQTYDVDKLGYEFVDVEKDDMDPLLTELASKVRSVPTFFIIRDGEAVGTFQGANISKVAEYAKYVDSLAEGSDVEIEEA